MLVTDRQTDRDTQTCSLHYFAAAPAGEVIKFLFCSIQSTAARTAVIKAIDVASAVLQMTVSV